LHRADSREVLDAGHSVGSHLAQAPREASALIVGQSEIDEERPGKIAFKAQVAFFDRPKIREIEGPVVDIATENVSDGLMRWRNKWLNCFSLNQYRSQWRFASNTPTFRKILVVVSSAK
jgi:hypothetical protein